MKSFLLSAALLLPVASAQGAVPAASAPTLRLSAPVGTGLELTTTTTSRTSLSNVQVTALPGSDVSEDEIADIKRSMSAGLGGAQQATTVKGKLFYRVTGRNADGSVTLLSSVIQSVPGQPPITLKIDQTVAQDGAVSGLKIQSDNPVVNAAFAGLDGEKLQQLADQNSSNFAGVYGQPLVKGQPREQTVTLDATGLLSGLLSAFASQTDLPELFGQIQSTPLKITTVTTYGGLNAQGLHTFTQNSRYDRWKITLGGSSDLPAMNFELASGQVSGTQTYRKDGLPGPTTQTVRQVMNMAMELEGVQIKLTLTIDQSVTAALR